MLSSPLPSPLPGEKRLPLFFMGSGYPIQYGSSYPYYLKVNKSLWQTRETAPPPEKSD